MAELSDLTASQRIMRLAKITLALVAIVVLVGFTFLGIKSGAEAKELNFETPKLQSTEAKLKNINIRYEKLNTQLHQKTFKDKKTIDEQNRQMEQLKKEREDLQQQIEARAAQKAKLAQAAAEAERKFTATQTASAAGKTITSSGGNCESWKAAAGVPSTNATNTLINKESGCNPSAYNKSSGACGIPQALPCSKMNCPLNESGAVCQLQWMDGYVKSRYGTWENALATWYSRCGSPQGCWY